jgi:hypothetical protein
MPKKNITPIFTDNADLQTSLAKKYETESAKYKEALDFSLLPVLSELRGTSGQGFKVTVANAVIEPSEETKQTDGYMSPFVYKTIKVASSGDRQDTLRVGMYQDEEYVLTQQVEDGSSSSLFNNPKRVDHAIRGWIIVQKENSNQYSYLNFKGRMFFLPFLWNGHDLIYQPLVNFRNDAHQ